MKWFRFYNEAYRDPKVQLLRPELFRFWVNFLCVASESESRGVVASEAHLKLALGVAGPSLKRWLSELEASALLHRRSDGALVPHNWEGRQKESDDVAERKRRQRETAYDETPKEMSRDNYQDMSRDKNVTPPRARSDTDTDTDTDTEKNTPLPPSGGMSPNGDLSVNFVLPTGSRKKAKADDVPFKIPDWISVDDWLDFEAMRKKIRKPLTDRARRAIAKELLKLQGEGHAPPAVLEQSIRNGWQDVFPIRQSNNVKPGQSAPAKRNPTLSEYEASQARIAAGKAHTEELNRRLRESRDA